MKKVLFCSEANYLATGYGVYTKELLSRLTKVYEVAEFATYGSCQDEGIANTPWKIYPNEPDKSNNHELQEYRSSTLNTFGQWRFEEVLLDFHPDTVIDIRDPYIVSYQARSPFRDYFKWLYMPTMDSYPLDSQWTSLLLEADGLLSYSEFGGRCIQKQCGDLIKYYGIAAPGANFNSFFPHPNKYAHKSAMGLEDTKIIGTVMRNQFRKLYPELFRDFRNFIDKYPKIAENTYLYCHTSYPDIGWKLPKYLIQYGVGHKVLFTYVCHNCNSVMPMFFQDARTACLNCKQHSMYMPKPKKGVPENALNNIYNIMDVYVQYSTNEGAGMSPAEATAAGVPVMQVDYSAMEDYPSRMGGIPIRCRDKILDHTTGAYRGYPDGQDFVEKLYDILSKPSGMIKAKGLANRELVKKNYSWDQCAEAWINAINDMGDDTKPWNSPPEIYSYPKTFPQGLTHEEFINWSFSNVLRKPELASSWFGLKMLNDLNWGHRIDNAGDIYSYEMSLNSSTMFYEFTQAHAFSEILIIAEKRDYWEKRRAGIIKTGKADYLCV